jgi:hypothetical protein
VSAGPTLCGPSFTLLQQGPTVVCNFLGDIGLHPLVPDEMKVDTKPECCELQRELHAVGIADSLVGGLPLSVGLWTFQSDAPELRVLNLFR